MSKFHNNTDALVWLDTSAEQCALYHQAFSLAKLRIDAVLNPRPEGEGDAPVKPDAKTRCVFTDCDETLLDNSEYNAWLVFSGRNYTDETWDIYCKDKRSHSCSGAVEFTKWLEGTGVQLFYVTSRNNSTRRETVERMIDLGFPLKPEDAIDDRHITHLFMKGMENPYDGTNKWEKWSQYEWIENHRGVKPILWLGDNLTDFREIYKTARWDGRLGQADSDAPASKTPKGEDVPEGDRKKWGDTFIVMPNPVYGAFLLNYKSKTDGHLYVDDNAAFTKQSVVVREPILPGDNPKLTELEVWPKFQTSLWQPGT